MVIATLQLKKNTHILTSLCYKLTVAKKLNFRLAQTPTQCQQVINQNDFIFSFDEDK